MRYTRALSERRRAARASRAAREELREASDALIDVYHAHPMPALASAAGAGFVFARLRIGTGVVRAGMRIATGPGWRLVRQYLEL